MIDLLRAGHTTQSLLFYAGYIICALLQVRQGVSWLVCPSAGDLEEHDGALFRRTLMAYKLTKDTVTLHSLVY